MREVHTLNLATVGSEAYVPATFALQKGTQLTAQLTSLAGHLTLE